MLAINAIKYVTALRKWLTRNVAFDVINIITFLFFVNRLFSGYPVEHAIERAKCKYIRTH
jgi:Na+/citrate or Na+/malate symporter